MIPYGRQDIDQHDIDAVVEVLRSDFLTQGPQVALFENTVADYCGASFGVAVNSATSALHIACLTLGLRQGDYLWTSPNTFVASANCGLYCGAEVDFVDIDPRTYCMSVEALEQKLIEAKAQNRLPKILVPVHFAGQSCDMKQIHKLSLEYGFSIIEDASHAIGGRYLDKPIGSCEYSDIAVFSFHPVKIITTGEGGIALTKDVKLANKMRQLRSHGITNEVPEMEARPDVEIWNYQQLDLGFNYRMNDIQAALGISQMKKLDAYVEKRHSIAKHYQRELNNTFLVTPWQHPDTYSSYHLYPVRLKLGEITKTQREVYSTLRNNGVLVNLHYIPVYLQPYYARKGFKKGYCPQAEKYFHEALTIPLFPTMTDTQLFQVTSLLNQLV